jgi:GNAT superfamily N-acetyltransferase
VKHLEFLYLAQKTEALPTVAAWYFDEWGYFDPDHTVEDAIKRLKTMLNVDRIPFVLLAVLDGEVAGAAELKYREMGDVFPDKEHWLGGVYVNAAHRGHGIGSRLVSEIVTRAPGFGVTRLYLQTPQLDGGLYSDLGWQPEQEAFNHGLRVQVMVLDVGA